LRVAGFVFAHHETTIKGDTAFQSDYRQILSVSALCGDCMLAWDYNRMVVQQGPRAHGIQVYPNIVAGTSTIPQHEKIE
jgi:hypothetical protein